MRVEKRNLGTAARSPVWVLLFVALCVDSGCTGVRTTEIGSAPSAAASVFIGSVEVGYDTNAIARDRLQRAEEIRLARSVETRLRQFLGAADLGSETGRDHLRLQLNAFRLPRGMRWYTGALKGNDRLGARIQVVRDAANRFGAQVNAQLGAGDRSIAANYSANEARDQLVDMLAWEVAWALTGWNGRRGEDALLDAGKQAGVERAVQVLAHRGQLSYGEFLAYAARGKTGLDPALSVKYDACGLRKLFTLGLSSCEFDPDYR